MLFLLFNEVTIIMSSSKSQMEVCVNIFESEILCIFPVDFNYRTPVLLKFALTYCEIMLCLVGLVLSYISCVSEMIHLLSNGDVTNSYWRR